MPGKGARTRLIADAYLPSAGAGRLAGHEAICILNDGIVMDKFTGGFVGPSGEQALVARLDRLLGTLKP